MPSKSFLSGPLEKRTYGLVGFPVKHSLSPVMHNAAFSALKINAEYRLFELKENELECFLKSLPQQNILGLNVTIPYKEKVIPFLDSISDAAKLIGAVNTIKVLDKQLSGYNTDGEGFIKNLKDDLGFDPAGKTVAIIGAGGAARAVCVYLCKELPKSVNIYDVDKNKLGLLAGHLKDNFKSTGIEAAGSPAELNVESADMLINATPIGMKETDPLIIDENYLHKGLLVYDLIYNPGETKLLKAAKKKGCRVSNGLGMLLNQGVIAFGIWTGEIAPKGIMRKALLSAL
jgi:shikimate dehydrogenase